MYVLGEKDALGYLEGPRGREKCLERTVQNIAMAEQIEASPGRESNANQDLEAWRSLESSAGYIVATQRLTRTSKPASPGNHHSIKDLALAGGGGLQSRKGSDFREPSSVTTLFGNCCPTL